MYVCMYVCVCMYVFLNNFIKKHVPLQRSNTTCWRFLYISCVIYCTMCAISYLLVCTVSQPISHVFCFLICVYVCVYCVCVCVCVKEKNKEDGGIKKCEVNPNYLPAEPI